MKNELVLKNVNLFSRDAKLVLSNIDFELMTKSIGVFGKSGSGKTSLARMIAKMIKPTYYEEFENSLQTIYVDQDYSQNLFPTLNVFDNIADGIKNSNRFVEFKKEEIKRLTRISDRLNALKSNNFAAYYKSWNTLNDFNEFTKQYLAKNAQRVNDAIDQIKNVGQELAKTKDAKQYYKELNKTTKTLWKNLVKNIENETKLFSLKEDSKKDDIATAKHLIQNSNELLKQIKLFCKENKFEEDSFPVINLLNEKITILDQFIVKINDVISKEAANEFKKIYFGINKAIEKFIFDFFIKNNLIKAENKYIELRNEYSNNKLTSSSVLLNNSYKKDSKSIFAEIEEAFAEKLKYQFSVELNSIKDLDKRISDNIIKLADLNSSIKNKKQLINDEVKLIANSLGIDESLFSKSISSLSGGQAQRVLLAKVLITRPELIILDEPTSSLDKETTKLVVNLVKDVVLKTSSKLVVVSHDKDFLSSLTDYVYVLENGFIVEKGKTKDVFTKPSSVYLKQLLGKSKTNLTINKSSFYVSKLKMINKDHYSI